MELAKSKTFERSIYYKGAKEWNSLDSSTRNIPTSLDFKRNQKIGLDLQSIKPTG